MSKEQPWFDIDMQGIDEDWGASESLINDWFAAGDSEDFVDRLEAEDDAGQGGKQPWQRAVRWVRSLTDNA